MDELSQFFRKFKNQITFNIRFFILCVVAGIGSALFSYATDEAYKWCLQIYHFLGHGVFIYIPLIFVIIAYLLKNYFPYAGGSGLPQGYALDVFEQKTLHATYSIRTMIGKVVLTFMSILGGASLGKEGPTIQICASVFASMKRITAEQKKFLIRVGSGVGVATAFNAPLGGIIFAIEEYIKHSDSKMNVALLAGIAIAGYFTVMVSGNYSYMGHINTSQLYYSWTGIFVSLVAGVICGLLGAFFTWVIVLMSVDKRLFINKLRRKYYLLNAAVFGLFVAYIGIMTHGLSFGNGADTTRELLNQNMNVTWVFALAKTAGTVFSVAAGVPGGYFSTSLSIGAGIMGAVHNIMPLLPLTQFYLLGMVGFLAAITGAPITAVAMIMSIVSDTQHFALPLILTSIIASYIASLFGESVYHQQVLIYVDKEKYNAIHKNSKRHFGK